jgi:hypothetical protein
MFMIVNQVSDEFKDQMIIHFYQFPEYNYFFEFKQAGRFHLLFKSGQVKAQVAGKGRHRVKSKYLIKGLYPAGFKFRFQILDFIIQQFGTLRFGN